jgi:hypothetical protein
MKSQSIIGQYAGVLAFEGAAEGAGDKDEAGVSLPALLAFIELAGTGFLRVTAFALLAMPSVEVERHVAIVARRIARYCPLKLTFAANLLIYFWR